MVLEALFLVSFCPNKRLLSGCFVTLNCSHPMLYSVDIIFQMIPFPSFSEKADSCTINALTFLKQTEILTVNSFGQLKLFDFRQNSDAPTQIFSSSVEPCFLLLFYFFKLASTSLLGIYSYNMHPAQYVHTLIHTSFYKEKKIHVYSLTCL